MGPPLAYSIIKQYTFSRASSCNSQLNNFLGCLRNYTSSSTNTMSITATTEACPASLCQRQPYWLETDDGQCVPLILSEPSSNVVVFKLDTKLRAKGHTLKMELKPPIPIAFSTRRSPSTEQSVRPCPPQEILTPAYIAPNHDHNGSGLPRRQLFGSVRICTSTFYLHVLMNHLGSRCGHAKLIS